MEGGSSDSAKSYSETQAEFETGLESQRNTEAHSSEQRSTSSPGQQHQDALENTESSDQLQSSPSSERYQSPQELPDLTQGIPSTLDAELEQSQQAASSSSNRATKGDSTNVSSRRGGGDDLPKTAYITSQDRRKEKLFNWMYAILFGGAIGGVVYTGRNWESLEEEHNHPNAPNGWGIMLFYSRVKARIFDTTSYFNEPAFPKLLPTPDPAWERPYTLVLSLEDLLVHSEWSRAHGWRMAKRPGVDYFLRYLSQYYEIVIFTSLPSMQGDAIIRKLDPYRIVMWPLFREATRYTGGEYVKVHGVPLSIKPTTNSLHSQDLSFLNRPLNKVIHIDTDPAHARLQPENAIILPKWKGTPNDKDLVSFIPFLEFIAAMETPDVRRTLESFSGTHIPTEYARREALAREKFDAQRKEELSRRRGGKGPSFLSNLFGAGAPPQPSGLETSVSEAFEQGKTYMDLVRERGQKQYEFLDKEIRENGHKWLAEMAAEEKKAQDEMYKNVKSTMFGPLMGGEEEKKN